MTRLTRHSVAVAPEAATAHGHGPLREEPARRGEAARWACRSCHRYIRVDLDGVILIPLHRTATEAPPAPATPAVEPSPSEPCAYVRGLDPLALCVTCRRPEHEHRCRAVWRGWEEIEGHPYRCTLTAGHEGAHEDRTTDAPAVYVWGRDDPYQRHPFTPHPDMPSLCVYDLASREHHTR